MVAAFDYCLHGKGGAAPSIDTAMHALVDPRTWTTCTPTPGSRWPPRPTARADARGLRRPGGLGALAAARASSWPGHRRDQGRRTAGRSAASSAGTASPPGVTAWAQCEASSLEIIRRRRGDIAEHAAWPTSPFGPVGAGNERAARGRAPGRAAALAPVIRGLAFDRPTAGRPPDRFRRRCWTSCPPQSGSSRWPPSARRAPTTSCAPRSVRSCVDLRPTGPSTVVARLASCTRPTGRVRGLLRAPCRRRTARRCAAPTRRSCCPGRRDVLLRQGQADRTRRG